MQTSTYKNYLAIEDRMLFELKDFVTIFADFIVLQ